MPRLKASNIDVFESFKNARLNLLDEQNKLEILLNEKQSLQSNEILSARQKRRDEQRAKLQKFAKVMTQKYKETIKHIQRREPEISSDDDNQSRQQEQTDILMALNEKIVNAE